MGSGKSKNYEIKYISYAIKVVLNSNLRLQ